MICPYKWAIDEEDDQTSSWESEHAEELASLETHDEEGVWCWPKKGRVTRWERRIDSRRAFHYLAEEDEDEQVSRGLNHLVPRKRRRSSVDAEECHRGGGLRSCRDCDASTLPEMGIRQTGPRMEKDSSDQEERTSRTTGRERVVSVRTPEGLVRKSTWQVSDVRRPLVSASHIIQAGNDLFIVGRTRRTS